MSNKVDAAQVTKAVAALRKHSEKVKAEGGSKLFDGDDDDDAETYSVMVSTRRVPQRASNKLVPIPLPHPLLLRLLPHLLLRPPRRLMKMTA